VRHGAFGAGFDETMRVGEDVDFIWRLHDAGWSVWYDADVTVSHLARRTWRAWWDQRVGYGASAAQLGVRHGRRIAPIRGDAWTLLAWACAWWGSPSLSLRILAAARRHVSSMFAADEDLGRDVARLVTRNMLHSGGPLARAIVRTFGAALLVAAWHPRLRTRALGLFALGTAWRWRGATFDVADVPLAVADDLAYGVGVLQGSWRARTWSALTPNITKPSMSVAEVLGLRRALSRG
jgi:hypothetical protein